MEKIRSFCTCKNLDCPLHPVNHKEGCTPCIRKNLRLKEVPSCFFHLIGHAETRAGNSYEDFAKLILETDQL